MVEVQNYKTRVRHEKCLVRFTNVEGEITTHTSKRHVRTKPQKERKHHEGSYCKRCA